RPVYLRDVATVEVRMVDRSSFVIQNGQPAIAVNAHRETGVNVLEVMDGLRQAVAELREGPLQRAGLSVEQVYDETVYINRSIAMVGNNLGLGILLAIGVLWWFFRKFRATLMVALAIPACVLGSFMILDAAGRTLNVISLAGLAFAVGMVLDAAIVVLENIVRLREQGESAEAASAKGTSQVWGALLASTATTVAIFLPVVFLADEAGQLFADLALTIAVAVCFSLLVAVTVLPTTAMSWLRTANMHDPHQHWWDGMTAAIMRITGPRTRLFWIVGLLTLPLLLVSVMIPKADYLPEGNRNLVFSFINPPPGANIEFMEKEMGQQVAAAMEPYLSGEKQPQLDNYFFVAMSRGMFMGARTVDPDQTGMLVPLINQTIAGFPDTIGFAFKASLFGGLGGGRSIDIDIQGRELEPLLQAGMAGFMAVREAFGTMPRPFPGLALAEPELRLQPDERRIAEAGWNRGDMGGIIRALGDGLYVADYFDGEQRLDVILRSDEWATPEELAAIPLASPNAGIQPLGELMEVVRTAGPDQLRRIDRRRTVTLQVRLSEGMSVEEGIELIKAKVAPAIEAAL
ncbi:MAG TPA: efflux RND transporter permease subunit, partial [Candidatus Tenderia sp.]|nr:efflux RND transporter permease subunit [Candidatus Tenderia sp.]